MLKVVIVDDEPWIRTLIRGLIPWNKLGFDVIEEAGDGDEGLEICQETQPNLVITDIRMPGLTGLELIKKLKLFCPETAVVIISGHDDFTYAQDAIKQGVFDYLLKPVDEDELKQILERVKSHFQQVSQEKQSKKKLETEVKKLQDLLTETDEGEAEVGETVDPRIQKALRYIHQNYHMELTLEDVAKNSFMGVSYLSEMFKQEMGKGFSEYLTDYRMEKAKQLLSRESSLKVHEVASMVGYKDSNYFAKIFKKKVGAKPTEYQTQLPKTS